MTKRSLEILKRSSTPYVRVGPSGVHGLGAFAICSLPAGAVLGLYEGRRYTAAEVAAKDWNDQLTFLFCLTNDEMIDGAKGGNATRHFNHACDPNCEAIEEYDNAGELVVKFVTLVPIAAGEELFIDYNLTAADDAQASDYPCHCGSDGCRGTMLVAEADDKGDQDEAPEETCEESSESSPEFSARKTFLGRSASPTVFHFHLALCMPM